MSLTHQKISYGKKKAKKGLKFIINNYSLLKLRVYSQTDNIIFSYPQPEPRFGLFCGLPRDRRFGEGVGFFVVRVSAVAFDPGESDGVAGGGGFQSQPEVDVFDRVA